MSAQLQDHSREGAEAPLFRNWWGEYLVDSCQRTILFWDTMRQRGNQYQESMQQKTPHVLHFDFELIADGFELPEPVNYGLARILPPAGVEIDPSKRPFVVVDPRAGHGPGIGGFKPESEIGVIMAAGHPCYFIGFTPEPAPGQTIPKVIRAHARFLEKIIERHPDCPEKPVIIGNCQAGWAAMMLAALHPDLCGPVIAAGAPLSYWAGVRGENTMRYTGGLLGGSWLTALISDLGGGQFNGSWLVQNFEYLNPANTLWDKQYNLYAKIDTEIPRYLEFERWWNAHVMLDAEEIQFIVDNLFIGNKLSTAGIITDDNRRIDFRNIKSPIICFCSRGDNITPPQQALGWILDLYDSAEDISKSGQTIIYTVHENIGHLGIFVSAGIAMKEHSEFAGNIDMIDSLPPGLYEIIIEKADPADPNYDLVEGDYVTRLERRTLDDIRALGGNTPDEERCFAAVARLSEANYGHYRSNIQPLVRIMAGKTLSDWLTRSQPLRSRYEFFSDQNPLLQGLPVLADQVRENRAPAPADNPFVIAQEIFADWMGWSLETYREYRDLLSEQLFFSIYSQSWLQTVMGLKASDGPARRHPGLDPSHIARIQRKKETLRHKITQGGPWEALLRGLLYTCQAEEASIDERKFKLLRRFREEHNKELTRAQFKKLLREQFFLLLIDEEAALEAIPGLLAEESPARRAELYGWLKRIAEVAGPPAPTVNQRLARVEKLFTAKNSD
jgi:pimeloyl-ACP methyl ester carboxylesterase